MVNEPLQLSGSTLVNPERINDLFAAACDMRWAARRDAQGRPGIVMRTRGSVGRRLMSLGSTVAGQSA